MRKRSRSRELALKALYLLDLGDWDHEGALEEILSVEPKTPGAEIYARALLGGVLGHREEIDGSIQEAAENWDLPRMPVMDRNALRIGVYEMIFQEDVPPKVAMDEAIEMAKRFGSKESGAFVNGILDRIARTRRCC